MARKPNYRMERMDRDRKKAERAAKKAEARLEKSKARQGTLEDATSGEPATESAGSKDD